MATKKMSKMGPVATHAEKKLTGELDNAQRGEGERVPVNTTITLDRALKEEAQRYAKAQGTTLSHLIEQGLYEVLGK